MILVVDVGPRAIYFWDLRSAPVILNYRMNMKKLSTQVFVVFTLFLGSSLQASAQCSITDATTCACETPGATNCDLLPDIMISWQSLESSSGGPSEYSQSAASNAARLRITGSTPNVGHGPLETRGVNAAGLYTYICGPDTIVTTSSTYSCTNGYATKQSLYQRIYHKSGNTMTYNDIPTGTMTFHAGHGHQHVNEWSTMTLRLAQPGENDPTKWPILASGGKTGYCLINLFTCSGSSGYCRTSHLYNQGSILTNTSFGNNYNLGFGDGCNATRQGIKVGNGDIYSENLDGMWINLLPGLCNGQYHIVAEVDPRNDFFEEDDDNNFASIPFTIAQQSAANSGGTANMFADGRLVLAPGQTRKLTASPGTAYLWSTGATTRSITVGSAGTYSCTVTCPCGSLSTPSLVVSMLAAPPAPIGTGATIFGPGTANLGATGTNVRWYDASTAGNQMGTGNSWTTPFIATTTNYWAEARAISPGVDQNVGKPNNSGTGAYSSTKQWLLFDAYEPFKLVSFKVYANSFGQRHFVMVDRLGNMIAEKYIEIPSGLNTITVNWDVPAGVQHKITAYDDHSEVVRDLYRNDGSVTYPYAIGTLGSITGSTGGSTFYYYLYDWVVHTDAVEAIGPRTMVTATVSNSVQVALKMKLEGPYVQGTGLMSDALRTAGLIPNTEPYTALGFGQAAGGGSETVTAPVFTVTGNNAIVDWVRAELRSSTDPVSVVATRQALLQRDGDVVALDGVSPITLAIPSGNYYVAVRHRNHLGAMTAGAMALTNTPTAIDFTLPGIATWGVNARKDISGTSVLWTGNAKVDSQLMYTGTGNDRDMILTEVGGAVPTNTTVGYKTEDSTMDGIVKYTGTGNDRDPILENIGGTVPTATRAEQLP